jgi:effector-binding domain-containing protein
MAPGRADEGGGSTDMSDTIEITTVPNRLLAVTRLHVASGEVDAMGDHLAAAFGRVIAHLERVGARTEGPAVATYQRAGDGFDVAAGFPVEETFEPSDDVDQLVLAAGEVGHVTHIGPYEDLPAAYDALRGRIETQGRTLDEIGPMWEEYWSAPETPPEQTRTEVFWKLAPARADGP